LILRRAGLDAVDRDAAEPLALAFEIAVAEDADRAGIDEYHTLW
jgi:hypothetical protein